MKNFDDIMKQAQAMQSQLTEAQSRLALRQVTGTSGGGMVTVTANGKGVVTRVKIDPALLAPEEIEILEDLVMAAVNDAKTNADADAAKEMAKLAGGLPLSGLFQAD